ncbi:MAG: copper resistance CopC/CopD family protein [Sporichthyaceae bacterium]
MRGTVARRGRVLAALVLSVLGLAAGVLAGGPAAARADLESSTPEDGALLSSAPSQVSLVFSEPVSLVPKGFRLLDGANAPVTIGAPTVTGAQVTVPLPPRLADDGYLLEFRVRTSDERTSEGSVAFEVITAPAAGDPSATAAHVFAESRPSVAFAAGAARWLSYGGAVLVLGVPLFVVLCWPTGSRDRRVRILASSGGVLVLLTAAAAVPIQAAQVNATGVAATFGDGTALDVLTAPYGEAMLQRAGCAVALVALLAAWSRSRRRAPGVLAAVAGIGLAVGYSRAGHPAAGTYPWLTIADDSAHLLATAVWLGGLAVLAGRILPCPPPTCAAILRRWSRVATFAVVVLVATGTVQAARELRSVQAAVYTEYGRWIVAKSVVLVAMLALANLGRRRVQRYVSGTRAPCPRGASLGAMHARPRAAGHVARLRWSVAWELMLAAVVLMLTAFLTATSPR